MRHLFIVNPAAGGCDISGGVRAAAARICGEGGEYEVYVTRAPGDAEDKVRRESERGGELRVYSAGGDGTLNECVNGAALRKNTAVAVYPTGTGNDFARMFGPERARLLDLEALVRGEVRPLDLIECCGRYGVNICCAGVDARIGTQVHRYSRLPLVGGKFAYMSSAVVNFFRGVCDDMSAEFDGRKVGGPLTLVCACNGRYYGGGFNPVPDARPDDGEIDFLVVRGMSRLDFLRFARRYSVGRAHELPGEACIRHRGRELTVEAREPVCVSVDGEELRSRSIVFRAVPGGVNFIFPRGMEFFKDSNMKTGEK